MKYVGKQKALAFAVMTMFASGAASAAVLDMTVSPATGGSQYAKEIKFDDTQTQTLVEAPAGVSLSVKLNFGPGGGGNDVYVRLTLSSGQWNPALAGKFTTVAGGVNSGNVLPTVTTATATTDLVADAYVSGDDPKGLIIHITSPTVALQASDTVDVTFNPTGTAALAVVQSTAANPISGTVQLSKSLHVTPFNANNNIEGTNKVGPADYIAFDGSVFDATANVAAGSVTSTVDVTKESKVFAGSPSGMYTAKLCSIGWREGTGLLLNGVAANATPAIESVVGGVLRLSGKFDSLASTKGRIYLTTSATCLAEAATPTSGTVAVDNGVNKIATTVTNTAVDFDLTNKWIADYVANTATPNGASVNVCFSSDGVTPIEQGTFTAAYLPLDNAGYANEASYDLGTCGSFEKNGTTAYVPLVLNPTSVWANYIRVTNPSNQGGNVHIYAYNDNGEAGTQAYTFNLPKGASTGLIPVSEIIAGTGVTVLDVTTADNAAGSTAGVGKVNKLRLKVEGEFGTAGGTDAIVVRSYVLPDANSGTFTQFQ